MILKTCKNIELSWIHNDYCPWTTISYYQSCEREISEQISKSKTCFKSWLSKQQTYVYQNWSMCFSLKAEAKVKRGLRGNGCTMNE